jgi:UDPglucose--hexose-1-phosphate uridylyltransferase
LSELRWDELTGRPVVVASNRALRPNEYVAEPVAGGSPADCPFCEGHEERTPPELAAFRPPGTVANGPGWTVRTIPNKFPTLSAGGTIEVSGAGTFYRAEAGRGAHEVVIEAPAHTPPLPDLPPEQTEAVFRMLRERTRAHLQPGPTRAVLVFENFGPESGGTLWHPHAQVIAAPWVSPRLGEELAYLDRSAASDPGCPAERALTVASRPELLVAQDERIVVGVPFASEHPYAARLVPRHHSSSMGDATDEELASLARLLPRLLRTLRTVVPNLSYNWYVANVAGSLPLAARYHWHLEVAPRLVRADGFEIGSGIPVNPVPPERAAALLRDAWERSGDRAHG